MGYTNVRDYSGGKKEWMEAGLLMEGEARALRRVDEERAA